MNVKSLITILQTFNANASVMIEDVESECYGDITNVRQVIPKDKVPIVMIDVSDL